MWSDQAACRTVEMIVFFPEREHAGRGGTNYSEARQVCAGCPVKAECLEDALVEERYQSGVYRHGMRGGLSPEQRASEERKRRRDAIGLRAVSQVGSLNA